MFKKLYHQLIMHLFVWSGSRLFHHVAIYPSGLDDNVKVVHWAVDEAALLESCKQLLDEHNKP